MAKKQLSLVRFMTAGVSESERLSNEDEGQVEDQSIQPGTEQSEIGTSIHDEPQCEGSLVPRLSNYTEESLANFA